MIELLITKIRLSDKLRIYNLKAELIKTLRAHTLFIALVFIYVVACIIAAEFFGITDKISLSLYSNNLCLMTILFFFVFIVGHTAYVMLYIRPEHSKQYILNDLRTNYLNTEHFCNLLLVLLILPIFMSAFTSFKIMIPTIHPFSWDSTFAKWDAVIHGGVQPWQLLQPILGRPFLTSTINFFYNLWFIVMYGMLFWQAFSLRNTRLRMQFLLTFILSWILIGTVAAIAFSSAGPCYYGRIVEGEDIFHPLMEYLWSAKEHYPVWSLNAQEMLWVAYDNREIGQVKGISAMPSMHVSLAFLFALVGWRIHRISGIVFSVFAFLTMIGCVHLGWHYAIDVYTAIVCTWLIWWAVGGLLNRLGVFLGV